MRLRGGYNLLAMLSKKKMPRETMRERKRISEADCVFFILLNDNESL